MTSPWPAAGFRRWRYDGRDHRPLRVDDRRVSRDQYDLLAAGDVQSQADVNQAAERQHVHAEDPRPVKLSVGMLAKGRLDRVDALAHAEQRRDVGTLEEQGFHRPVAHLFSLSGCE